MRPAGAVSTDRGIERGRARGPSRERRPAGGGSRRITTPRRVGRGERAFAWFVAVYFCAVAAFNAIRFFSHH
jgi:hypothetical protein